MNSSARFIITPTQIVGVLVIESSVFRDDSGWFTESFNTAAFKAAAIGLDVKFVQDNHSFSKQWTLRGMHFQTEHPQGKLVRAIQGCVFDVAVDVRKNSATYGKWIGVELSADNHKQMCIPPGLAHGFLVLSPTAEILYKTTDYYHPESEVCLAWDDFKVDINWPLPDSVEPIMSAKDRIGLSLNQPVTI